MRNIVKSDKMLHAMRMNEAELNYFCRIYFKERRADMLKITESFKMSLTAYLRIFWRENMMRFMPLLKLVMRKLSRRNIISKLWFKIWRAQTQITNFFSKNTWSNSSQRFQRQQDAQSSACCNCGNKGSSGKGASKSWSKDVSLFLRRLQKYRIENLLMKNFALRNKKSRPRYFYSIRDLRNSILNDDDLRIFKLFRWVRCKIQTNLPWCCKFELEWGWKYGWQAF